jgi:short-subunit dehydrogenase
MQSEKTYTLITGATSGIGYELAKLFGSMGHNLILVARTESDLITKKDELTALGIEVITISKDLFDPRSAAELYQEVKNQRLEVDVLVNDAGQGQYGLFVENDINRYQQLIQLNIVSLTTLTHLFLKDMVAKNKGKILQLASIASETPGPYQAVYHATKAYVLSLTEALINEVKDTDVTITALQPGVTDTDFFNKAEMLNSKAVQDKSKMADPAKVAKDGYDALMAGKDKVVSGWKNKIQTAVSNIIPDKAVADKVAKEQEPVSKGK